MNGINNIGGLAGLSTHGTVLNSFAIGPVKGTDNVGGLIGGATNSPLIEKSMAAGDVSGINNVGSLVGHFGTGGNSRIQQSLATGNVSGTATVGGLVGQLYVDEAATQTSISDSYATGSVSATNVGGFLGRYDFASVGTANFWDTTTSGQATSGGPTEVGLITGDMQTQANFIGWDFIGTWTTNGDTTYLRFWWE